MRALFLSRFDSFTKAALCVSLEFQSNGIKTEWCIINSKNSKGINYTEYGLDKNVRCSTINALINDEGTYDYDFVVIFDTGSNVRRFVLGVQKNSIIRSCRRPLIITGYPGVSFSEVNTGYSNKCLCDVLLLSNKFEYLRYKKFCYENGLNFNGYLWGWYFSSVFREKHQKETILYVDQNVIPSSHMDRKYTALQLCELACARKNAEIIVLIRSRKDKGSLFEPKWHIEQLIKEQMNRRNIKNLSIQQGDINEYLAKADRVITVSSTVAIQSILSGIPTSIIRDFGVNDNYGTSYFKNSGLLQSFAEIRSNKAQHVNMMWYDDYVYFKSYNRVDIINSIKQKLTELRKNNLILENSVYSKEYINFMLNYNNIVNDKFSLSKLFINIRRFIKCVL